MSSQISLPNGCRISTPSVNPKNWKTGGIALLKKNWHVQYYFYNNDGRKPKLIIMKGMNSYKTLAERRDVTRVLIEYETDRLKKGYNPITKRSNTQVTQDVALHPQLQFMTAFRVASTKIQCTSKHRKEMDLALDRLESHIFKLDLKEVLIKELTRSQLKQLMDACKLPPSYYNKFLSFLSSIYSELLQYECCPYNIVRDLRKHKVTKKAREILKTDHHKLVMDHLHSNHYEFWRYARIFLFSGARSTELFRLQAKDVDIKNQEYKVTIKKGSNPKEVIKVIMEETIPLWEEVLNGANPNDYLFSNGLQAGATQIKPYQITKRWYRLVKKSDRLKDSNGQVVNITADFYSLKHSFLDSLPQETAMLIASHTNSRTTSIYRVNEAKNQREKLKSLKIDTSHFGG